MKGNAKNKNMLNQKAKQLLSEKKAVKKATVKETKPVVKETVEEVKTVEKVSVAKPKVTKKTPKKAAEPKPKAVAEPKVKEAVEPKKKTASEAKTKKETAKVAKPATKTVKKEAKEATPKTKETAKKPKVVKDTETKPAKKVAPKKATKVKDETAKPVKKAATKKSTTKVVEEKKAAPKKQATKKTKSVKAEVKAPETPVEVKAEEVVETKIEEVPETPVETKTEETVVETPAPVVEEPVQSEPVYVDDIYYTPRKSVAFIGSECYPFVKTGGLGDVMYALPKELAKLNCDVKVILPRYKCIPWEYQEKMVYRGAFDMNLCADGRSFYVGIMEYVWDGVVYDFIDNEEFFSNGNPYTNLVDDIPKFCFFAKAALAALNYMDWVPDIIHCHDWQASLVPVYLRTLFENTKLTTAKTIVTIHNLKFQGVYDIPTIKYWSGLPDYVFSDDALKDGWVDANMLKGGLKYCNAITTVSNTYAGEIQSPEYGENLDAHLRYHSGKLRGIINGIDYDIWNPNTDERIYANYGLDDAIAKKRENKLKLQEELGLAQDEHKIVIGLISRLTDQKGLDLINCIIPQIMDEHTQLVILGTGEPRYEDAFRYYEGVYKGNLCSNIMYDETRAHRIYASADALLVPSRFEPCGLTQLIGMRYGTIPVVRETGGLKDTVEPYNMFNDYGNGFTFDKYDAQLLLDAINRAKTLYFNYRDSWNNMVLRDMNKNLSWYESAKQYKYLYLDLLK